MKPIRIRCLAGAPLVACLLLPLGACDREAPREPPGAALAPRLLHDQAEMEAYLEAFPYEEYTVHEVSGVGKFYLDDNPALVKEFLRRGQAWEPYVVREFRRYVIPGSIVLDVGAHIGSHTITLSRAVGPEGRVLAFEPQKKVYRELVYNLRLNEITNAVPLRYAVSSEPGIVEMEPARAHDGRVRVGGGGDRVEARTIDSFGLSDVSLIKIDVEGHELDVLQGSVRTIRAFHPVIIIEITWSETYELSPPGVQERIDATRRTLRELGYRLERLQGEDYLAVHEEDERRGRGVVP